MNDFTHKAEERLDARVTGDHPRRHAVSDRPADDPATLRAEQFREADDVGGGPGVPILTGGMFRGMVGGGAAGALLGALVALPFALIPFFDLALAARLVVVAVAGAAAGATAGALYFGGRIPELSGESLDADNTPSAGSSLADPHTDARGR